MLELKIGDRAVAAIIEVLKGLAPEVEGSGPLEVFVDHLKITCTKEGVTLDVGSPGTELEFAL